MMFPWSRADMAVLQLLYTASSLLEASGLIIVTAWQSDMTPVENPMVVTFTRLTTVQPVLRVPELTYCLTSFEDLPAPSKTPRWLLDVGVKRGISNVATLNLLGRNILASRRNIVLADCSGNEIRITLWGEAAFRFNGQVIRYLSRDESAVVIFVGLIVCGYEGSVEFAGSETCRWYINNDIQEINILGAEVQASFQPIAQLPAPREFSLRPPVTAYYPTRPLAVLLKNIGFFQNQASMFRCIVKIPVSAGQLGPLCFPIFVVLS